MRYDDTDNKKPGWKFSEYELKGVPVRLALGGRDLENGTVEVARRDTLTKETCAFDGIADHITQLLDEIQQNIYQKALDYRESHTITVDTYEEFKEKIEEGGFILAHWDGTPETEEKIKAETKATDPLHPPRGRQDSRQVHGHRQALGSACPLRPRLLTYHHRLPYGQHT